MNADPSARPLDLAGAALIVLLCLSWGFNQVAVKLALPDIPPLPAKCGTLQYCIAVQGMYPAAAPDLGEESKA